MSKAPKATPEGWNKLGNSPYYVMWVADTLAVTVRMGRIEPSKGKASNSRFAVSVFGKKLKQQFATFEEAKAEAVAVAKKDLKLALKILNSI